MPTQNGRWCPSWRASAGKTSCDGEWPALALLGCALGGERGGEIPCAAGEPGQGDRVHVVVIADDLAVSDPDDAEGGERVRPAGDGGVAAVGEDRKSVVEGKRVDRG